MMEISFYREKLSESGHRMLNASIEESQRRHHYYLGLEHLFIAFADPEKAMFQELMAAIGLNVEAVLFSLAEHLNISRTRWCSLPVTAARVSARGSGIFASRLLNWPNGFLRRSSYIRFTSIRMSGNRCSVF